MITLYTFDTDFIYTGTVEQDEFAPMPPGTTTPVPELAENEIAIWRQGEWVKSNGIPSEITADKQSKQADAVRARRNTLLAECDWTQSKDIPDSISVVWQPYRLALRDITEQQGFPFNVVWPQKP